MDNIKAMSDQKFEVNRLDCRARYIWTVGQTINVFWAMGSLGI